MPLFARFRAGISRRLRRRPLATIADDTLGAELDTVDTVAARLEHIQGYLLGECEELEPTRAA